MNNGGDAADQVIRYSLEGTEIALRLSGTAAKNFAVFVAAVLKDQQKIHGKTNLVRMLKERRPMKFFNLPAERMHEFAGEAKRHGLLFVPIRDKQNPDIIEMAVFSDDAAKVNRIMDRMTLDFVKAEAGNAAIETAVQTTQPQDHATLPEQLLSPETPNVAVEANNMVPVNFTNIPNNEEYEILPQTKESQFGSLSNTLNSSQAHSTNEQRPSVKNELKEIKENKAKEVVQNKPPVRQRKPKQKNKAVSR